MKEQAYIAGNAYIIKYRGRKKSKELNKIEVIEVTNESIYFLDLDSGVKERWGLNLFNKVYKVAECLNFDTRSEQCSGCDSSTGETKLWCCNHCGKRIEDF